MDGPLDRDLFNTYTRECMNDRVSNALKGPDIHNDIGLPCYTVYPTRKPAYFDKSSKGKFKFVTYCTNL